MASVLDESRVTEKGVVFSVQVGEVKQDCIVSLDALVHLRETAGFSMNLANVYRAFKGRIYGVARRQLLVGERASPRAPLVLGPQFFH